jgi:ABC-2 type transport system ATP-binding protein
VESATTARPPVIEGVGLTKRFREDLAIEDFSLSVGSGETYCLLGGSRSGKTTALRLLLGLQTPDAGYAVIDGIRSSQYPQRARARVTAVVGKAALDPALSIYENAAFFLALAGSAQRSTVDYWTALRLMGVPDRAFRERVSMLRPEVTLSVWLAIALLHDSLAVILDDPTVQIDGQASARLVGHIARVKASGKAVIIATSDVLFASQTADRVGILKNGRRTSERSRTELAGLSLTELYLECVGDAPPLLGLEPALSEAARR